MNLKDFTNKENLKRIIANANRKQIAGFVILVIGIILFILAIDAMRKIDEANSLSQAFSNFFEHNPTWNPIIKFFGGEAQEKIEYYSHQVLLIQIVSVVLIALGAIMLFVYRRKRSGK